MSKQHWFSATLRFYTVVADVGKIGGEDSVFLVRAEDFKAAFRKFLAVGKKTEKSYKNAFGKEVRVRFVEIVTIDQIDEDDLDGAEVISLSISDEDPAITFSSPLDPDKSRPTHTGI